VKHIRECDGSSHPARYAVPNETAIWTTSNPSTDPMTSILQACAWEVNNILSNAGLRKIGSNPDYVPSVVAALQAGRGRQISEAETVPGDLTVAWCVFVE